MKSKYKVPIAIFIGGVIISSAIYISSPKKVDTLSNNGNPALVRPVGKDDHIFGNPNAKVMIIEYADFDDIHSKEFNSTLQQLIADAGVNGKVAWVFRQFPLTELHANALKHAEASECIAMTGGNEAFWAFEDLLFKNQPVDTSTYGTLAQKVGINDDSFSKCFMNADNLVKDRIMKDRENALDSGAIGTPFSIIYTAGKVPVVVEGSYPYPAISDLIEEALND